MSHKDILDMFSKEYLAGVSDDEQIKITNHGYVLMAFGEVLAIHSRADMTYVNTQHPSKKAVAYLSSQIPEIKIVRVTLEGIGNLAAAMFNHKGEVMQEECHVALN